MDLNTQQERKAKKFNVWLVPDTEDGPERKFQITMVWKDRLTAEREGASLALNGSGLDKHEAALTWWAAMVRTGQYSGGFWQFVDDLIEVLVDQPEKDDEDTPAFDADPTQPAASSDSA